MKSSRGRDHFDLLPFIAIMMCLLGCLLLVTISMASINVGVGAGEVWVPAGGEKGPGKTPILLEWDGSHVCLHKPTPDGRSTRIDRLIPYRSFWVMVEDEKKKKTKAATPGSSNPEELTDDEFKAIKQRHEAANKKFADLLVELGEKAATHYALFAVRPLGFDSFREVSQAFREKKIDIGYEPLNNQDKPVGLRLPSAPK